VRACFARAIMRSSHNQTNHMKLFANVRILAVEENSFKDKETNATVTFFRNYIKDDSGSVIELNSGRKNLSQYEGASGVAVFELRNINDKWTPKIVDFSEGQTIEEPELTVE